MERNHCARNSYPWCIPVCVCLFLVSNFSSLCFSVWKSNIGCPSLSQSLCSPSSHHLSPCLCQSVWVVCCKLLAWFVNRYAMFAVIAQHAFKLIQYCHQTESLCGGFLKALCQFPIFFWCYLSTLYLILQDSSLISQEGGRRQCNDEFDKL